jgi:hypothetical protein
VTYSSINFDEGITVKSHMDGSSHTLQSLPPNEAKRALGLMLSPDGDGSAQIQVTKKKAREFFSKFINGTMSKKTKWVAINSIIEPSLIYPLVTTSYSPKKIGPIDSFTSQMKCLALGLSCKFPRAILHGPTSLGGMEIPSASQKNTKDRLNYFLYNIRLKSSIVKKLEITIIYSQIEVD